MESMEYDVQIESGGWGGVPGGGAGGQQLKAIRHLGSSTIQQSLKSMQLLPGRAGRSALQAGPGPDGGRACSEQPCPVHVTLPVILELSMLMLPA